VNIATGYTLHPNGNCPAGNRIGQLTNSRKRLWAEHSKVFKFFVIFPDTARVRPANLIAIVQDAPYGFGNLPGLLLARTPVSF
jgi:hypothetical protein